jgi:hypothetical protein
MFATPAHAEWTKFGESADGDIFYVDFERIREHSRSVFYWQLFDLLKPNEVGSLSARVYVASMSE